MKTKILALFIIFASLFLNSCTNEEEAPAPPVATATPTAQNIESGTTTSISLSSSMTGTTFSWTVVQSGVTGASSGSGSSISQTLSASGVVAGTATYLITPSLEGTQGNVVSVTITVNPKVVAVVPVATATPETQTIESGTATSIALSGSLTGTTFAWTVVQSGVTGATGGSGASINQTLSSTPTASGTVTYTIIPSLGGTTGTAVLVTITVNAGKVTYSAHVKPLLTTSCKPCHVAGGYNPKFDQYDVAKSKINGIIDRVQREKTAAGFMPQGGSKLSAENIALLKKWMADGLLE